jgi:hypothetical protein
MATIATIHGVTYTDDDFNAVNYANKFQQLIGDIYEHICTKYAAIGTGALTIGTGSKSLTISNLSSANLAYSQGQWVYLHPQAIAGTVPTFIRNYMLGVVTSVGATSITVNVIISHGSGTYNSFYISYAGEINQAPGTVAVSNGGTGATALATAKQNIGLGDPSVRAHSLFDDFDGYFAPDSTGYSWTGEHFVLNTLDNPQLPFNINTNPDTGGEFLRNPQSNYPGDDFMFNLDPRNDGLVPQNDWSSHPGVIGLSGTAAGSKITMMKQKFSTSGAPGFINFPYTNDVLEFQFMIPIGESFSEDNSAGFSLGVVMATLTGYVIVFNIGHGGALPFSNPLSPIPGNPPPSVLGNFMAASVITYDPLGGIGPDVWTDAASQTTTWSPVPGTWYKVRLTKTQCLIYRDGAILMRTISGWTAPTTPDNNNPSMFWCGFNKTSGSSNYTIDPPPGGGFVGQSIGGGFVTNRSSGGGGGITSRATVLLDYIYHRHPITAR